MMKLTLTPAMLAALDHAADKPDWLVAQVNQMKQGSAPYLLQLTTDQSTALEELCAMNIRFGADGKIRAEHQPLDDLATLVMENY